jgi:hypothetical protein
MAIENHIMKKLTYILTLLAVTLLGACKYDNFESPAIDFSGDLTYGGKPFQFDGYAEGTGLSKIIELYQTGFGKSGVPITASVGADGKFKQQIFAGDYQVTIKNTAYPFTFDNWATRSSGGYDSLKLNIKNDYTLSIPVTPYFEIKDVTWAIVGTNLNVTFNISKIQEGATVSKARVYVNTASIVNSGVRASAEAVVTDITKPVTVQFSLPNYRTKYSNNFRDYAFIRVALETNKSTSYFLWSDVYKVEKLPVEFDDVTATYLKNFKQPFETTTKFNDRRYKVKDWSVDPTVEPTMYDGWGDRLFMGAENWGGANTLLGSVWQTVELPAGKYVFIAKRGWNNGDLGGRTDRAYVVVSKGDKIELDGANLIKKADCGLNENKQALTLDFELTAPTKVSMGYNVNFRGGETNAVSFTAFQILRVD